MPLLTIQAEWVTIQQLRERIVQSLLRGENLDKFMADISSLSSSSSEQLTKAEKWAVDVIIKLGQTALNKGKFEEYQALCQALSDLDIEFDCSAAHLDWNWIHNAFTGLETAKLLTGYLSILKQHKNQVKFSVKGYELLTQEVESLMSSIREKALDIKNKRPSIEKSQVDQLIEWSESMGLKQPSLVTSIIQSVWKSHDRILTKIRSN